MPRALRIHSAGSTPPLWLEAQRFAMRAIRMAEKIRPKN